MNFSIAVVGTGTFPAMRLLEKYDPLLCAAATPWQFEGPHTFDRIRQFYPEGEAVLYLSGNLSGLFIREHGQSVKDYSHSLRTLTVDAFRVAHQNGTGLWGVCPMVNPAVMREYITLDCRHIGPRLWGMWNTADPDLTVTIPGAEDIERSILAYRKWGRVLRVNYVAAEVGHNGPDAGDNEFALLPAAVGDELREKYPDTVRLVNARGGNVRLTFIKDRGKVNGRTATS